MHAFLQRQGVHINHIVMSGTRHVAVLDVTPEPIIISLTDPDRQNLTNFQLRPCTTSDLVAMPTLQPALTVVEGISIISSMI